MRELRLTDPNGYTVPGAVIEVPDDEIDTVTGSLHAKARENAAAWGLDHRDYRIRNNPA
jgi:hypothetical protein